MVQNRFTTLLIVLLSMAASACTMRAGDFTVSSTKNIGHLSQKGTRVTGEDCSTNILGFIPVAGPMVPNMKTAIDKALEKGKGDVLTDAILTETTIITLIVNQRCFKVEGNVARGEFAKK